MTDIEKQKAFAQDIVAVLRKHDAYASDITFRLRGEGVFEQTRMTYDRGRHGSDGKINLIVTTHIGDFREEPQP